MKPHSDQRKRFAFSTPPATWNRPPSPALMPLSERKVEISSCKRDLFHVIHKVPSGHSPYVKAKHVQLIEKDPSKAISLFWAAINVGDRVDSALKDMAVVMKQLNRSDEAIEAIKSFRHLCPYESQESIDNVLVELYKRSGRIEEEIEMLQRKLKDIEEGAAFGGKRTKIARSQGKKIQITPGQERSRILGNLAWAYMQHHDYGLAEQHYRKALFLEPDKNKQCNLAMCLMHMNRLPEAKSLLQGVRDSCGSRQMDDSYAKSYDRACQMLSEFESQQALNSQNKAVVSPSPVLFTQPRKCSLDQNHGDHRCERIGGCKVQETVKKIPAHMIRNLNEELRDSTNENSQTTLQRAKFSLPWVSERDSRRKLWKDISHGNGEEPVIEPVYKSASKENGMRDKRRRDTYARMNLREVNEPGLLYNRWNTYENGDRIKYAMEDGNASKYDAGKVSELHQKSNAIVPDCTMLTVEAGDSATKSVHKSWADIAEEEEQELESGKDSCQNFNCWNSDEESNNENVDSNLINPNLCSEAESVRRKLGGFELKDGYTTPNSPGARLKYPTARRCLCFKPEQGTNMTRRNRLEVFRNITPSPGSP